MPPIIEVKDLLSVKNMILQLPLVAIVCAAMYFQYKGVWMWASHHEQTMQQCLTEKKDMEAQRDAYAWIAFRGTRFAQERAKSELDKLPEGRTRSDISAAEKDRVTRPVQRTDPKTLDNTLKTAQTVVEKAKG